MNATAEPAKPAVPSKRGDIISDGVYEGGNGDSVCWIDFVSDELLYAISKGTKGWATVRSEPARFSDKMKLRKLDALKEYVYSLAVLGIAGFTSGGKS